MSARLTALASVLALTACGDDASISGSATDSSTHETSETSATRGPTTSEPTTSEPTTTTGSPDCTPGQTQPCACPEGQTGIQPCDDAQTWGACTCPDALCGDGLITDPEQCDDGLNDGAYGGCLPDCSAPGPRCGDAVVNGPEACDDGNPLDADGCNHDCIFSGSPLWTRGYAGEDAGNARARGVAVDTQGNVIIVGQHFVVGHGADVWARKYSPAGDPLWTWTYQGPDKGDDIAYAVATTPDNDLVIVGETRVKGNGADMFFIKLGPDSSPVWQTTYNGDANLGDRARGVAVDPAGNIAVTGETYRLIGLDNVFTRLMDRDGLELWTDIVDANKGNDGGNAVAFTAKGDIVVAGHIYVPIGLSNLWLRKYTAAGAELWTRTADHMKGNDEWHGLAIAANGDIGLSGEVYEIAGLAAILTARYSAAGYELWSQIHDSKGGDNDRGLGAAFDPADDLVSVGSEYTANDFTRTWTRKYDPKGLERWTQTHDGDGAGNDIAHAVAIDPAGNIYAAGSEYVVGQFATVWLTKYAP